MPSTHKNRYNKWSLATTCLHEVGYKPARVHQVFVVDIKFGKRLIAALDNIDIVDLDSACCLQPPSKPLSTPGSPLQQNGNT